MFFLCFFFLVLFCCLCGKRKRSGRKRSHKPYFCATHHNYFDDTNVLTTGHGLRRELKDNEIGLFFFKNKKNVIHVPKNLVGSRPDGYDGKIWVCSKCQEKIQKNIEDDIGTMVNDNKKEQNGIHKPTFLSYSEDIVANQKVCLNRGLLEDILLQFSQGIQDSSGEKKSVLFNDFKKNTVKVKSIGRCPFVEIVPISNVEKVLRKCPKHIKWERKFLETFRPKKSQFSKSVCESDYEAAFYGRGIGITVQQLLEQNELMGLDSSYGSTVVKDIFRRSSAFMIEKAKEVVKMMIEWEKKKFCGPDNIACDENWERKQSKILLAHALNNCVAYFSGETGLPLDFFCYTVSMITRKDGSPKSYHEWRNSEDPLLREEQQNFPAFTNLHSFVYITEKFPDLKSINFDGCSDNVKNFYDVLLPRIAKSRGVPHEFRNDSHLANCQQSFDGWHGNVKKYERLAKYFPKFHNKEKNDGCTKSLFDTVMEFCKYEFSAYSEDWYFSSLFHCLENIYSFAESWNRVDEIHTSEEKLIQAIRYAGSTTYLRKPGWKNPHVLDYMISDTEVFDLQLKLQEYWWHRREFHGKFKKSHFAFIREGLTSTNPNTAESDRFFLKLFDASVDLIVSKDYSKNPRARGALLYFFEYFMRIHYIHQNLNNLIGDELTLIFKSLKPFFQTCGSTIKGVKNKIKVLKGESSYSCGRGKRKTTKKLNLRKSKIRNYVNNLIYTDLQFSEYNVQSLNELKILQILEKYSTQIMHANFKHPPFFDYGFFNIEESSDGCENFFNFKTSRFGKLRHKGLLNFEGDFAFTYFRSLHSLATKIREDEKQKGIKPSKDCFWSLGIDQNIWGGKDVSFPFFLKKIAKEEFLVETDLDLWYNQWMDRRGKDIDYEA